MEIHHIDYEFVEKCEKPARLKRALKILEEDGGHYPDLTNEIKKKLRKLDPNYKDKKEQNEISYETRK